MSNISNTAGRLSLQDFAMVNDRIDVKVDRAVVGEGANPPSLGQTIKDAFQNFGAKISEKFSAFKEKLGDAKRSLSTLFEGVKTRMAERAEARQVLKNERLDTADRAKAGRAPSIDVGDLKNTSLGLLINGGNKKESHVATVSNELTGILSQIKQRASDNGADPVALRREVVAEFVATSSAIDYREADTRDLSRMATKFAKEGRTEKADFLRDMIHQIEDGRSPEGARERFKDLALGVSTQGSSGGETFLRATSNVNTSAVKKLMDAEGAGDIGTSVRGEAGEIGRRADVVKLGEELATAKLGQMSHEGMTGDKATKLGHLAVELLDMALSKPLTEGMKETLSDITDAIQRDGGIKADDMTHKLFSDQLVLKMISPALSKDSTVVRMATDFINVVANGVRDQTKWSPEARQVYLEVGPVIHQKIEDYFTAAGMPDSAKTTW